MTVLETCKTVFIGGGDGGSSKEQTAKDPKPMPASYTAPIDSAESDSNEGPLFPGADKRGPSQSKETVKPRAAQRSHGLPSTFGLTRMLYTYLPPV